MPNMDDISYFASAGYTHRGGIWADAVRRERQPTAISEPSDPNTPISQPQVETGPELLSTTLVSPPLPTQDQIPPTLPAGDNRDQDQQEHSGDSQQKDEGSETSHPPRSTTSAVSQTRVASSSATKRRSWFMSARDEDFNTGSEPSLVHEDDETGRGRPEETIPDRSLSSRSASTHSDTGFPSNPSPSSEPSSLPKTPPPLPRRKQSPHQPHDLDEAVPTPSKSPPSLLGRVGTNASTNSNASSASSFFSTLKARAADKEALKDTAKEAMKKWSANWASLKKGSSDEPAPTPDDGQAKGSSYAEVRKHVEERHRVATSSGPETPPLGTSERTSPSPHTRGGSRKVSISGNAHVPTRTLSSNPDSVTQDESPPVDQDDAPRDREPETDVTPPASTSHPIYTQPSAPKMMMIPGIHASHRGEVQSMGNVAPTPEPAEPKPKAPVIQSVYRLWKNPASNQVTSTSKDLAELSYLESGETGTPPTRPSQNESPIPTSTSPNLKRLIPPPLPARTAAIRPPEMTVTRALPDPVEFGNVSASAALKSIATLDNNSRRHSSSSFDQVENGLQPPQIVVTGNS